MFDDVRLNIVPELDVDRIHPWIGLDWIGLGQDFQGTLWTRLGGMTAAPHSCLQIMIHERLTIPVLARLKVHIRIVSGTQFTSSI